MLLNEFLENIKLSIINQYFLLAISLEMPTVFDQVQ
jgi:hypothetical protein